MNSLSLPWVVRRENKVWLIALAVSVGCGSVAVGLVSGRWAIALNGVMSVAILAWTVFGLRRAKDRSALTWIVTGAALWIVGDIAWDWIALLSETTPTISLADIPYLLGYPTIATGILRLQRLRSPIRDREGWIDGLALAVSALLAAWQLLIVPGRERDASPLGQAVSAGYPVGDVLLLAALAWLAFTPGRPTRSLHLLLLFGTSTLILDVTFAFAALADASGIIRVVSSLYPLTYLVLALAVRHPSVDEASEPIHRVVSRTNPVRLLMLGSTLYVVPVLTVVRLGGDFGDVILGLGGTTCLATLVVARFVIVIRDREAMQEGAAFRALHDELTGLANRQLFLEHVDLARHRQLRTGNPYAVLFVDLDRFKSVNDTWGHATGDAVLVAASRSLERSVRPNDVVARIGGDEFAVLCEDLTRPAIASDIAERIVGNISADLPNEAKVVAASVGVAFASPTDSEVGNAESLLHRADLAMYRAKGEGGDAWRTFDDELRVWSEEQRALDTGARASTAH